jgi:hypothetical protein
MPFNKDFQLTHEEIALLAQYESEADELLSQMGSRIDYMRLLDLRVKYHAMLIAPHYEEFFGDLYLAIEGGLKHHFEPRHVLDMSLHGIDGHGSADILLCEIMFVGMSDKNETTPEYLTEAARQLSGLPEYQHNDLPLGISQFDSPELMAARGKW